MLFFHSKIILIFTLMLMASTISIANQDFGLASAQWVESELKQLEEDRRVWVEKVLETEIDPNFIDEDGNTPLMVAVRYAFDDDTYFDDWSEIVMALLEAGADSTLPSSQQRFFGNITTTPLAEAINTNSDHRITIALIQAKEDEYIDKLAFCDDQNDTSFLQQPLIAGKEPIPTSCNGQTSYIMKNNENIVNIYKPSIPSSSSSSPSPRVEGSIIVWRWGK